MHPVIRKVVDHKEGQEPGGHRPQRRDWPRGINTKTIQVAGLAGRERRGNEFGRRMDWQGEAWIGGGSLEGEIVSGDRQRTTGKAGRWLSQPYLSREKGVATATMLKSANRSADQ